MTDTQAAIRTPLFDLHERLNGRMVSFAGYMLPVQYTAGILAEHLWTRESASLFDVSHMGQIWLTAPSRVAEALETLVPGDIKGLSTGQIRYTQLTNEQGGIIDDLLVTLMPTFESGERLFLVLNASRKQDDLVHIQERLAGRAHIERLDDRALLALQGPAAFHVLRRVLPIVETLRFMTSATAVLGDKEVFVSRSGYTGEDGFEISLPSCLATSFAEALLADPAVKPAGLGARDSLRMEAGLCLYGQDLDETTSPIEAGLSWSVSRRRREQGGFLGYGRIAEELRVGPKRRLVGLRLEGRTPARRGELITSADGNFVGKVTSGGFGPSANCPIALGYVDANFTAKGSTVNLMVRERSLPAEIVQLPFIRHRYVKD
ncbi:glycine cleavage system aminomethyltransferase GcvT [Rhodoligotrophos appendicifer]|uniref:glycine cleavage system aminomethyltransferase GcvT n=1 Tax=Rhodoligotrophos appendicifer TaxID=987056 RepID=UPI0011846D51|nr:glycine cleavage system aminomethyltransferase GcvT [Rhodoligotrophos appendicifer]